MDTTGIKRFTVFEAEFALYESVGDVPSAEKFIGGFAEKVSFSGRFGEAMFQYQGSSVEEVRHISQGYEFEIVNPMSVRVRGTVQAELSAPPVTFNRTYIFVVAWYDEASTAWRKHCYFGVTLQPDHTEGSAAGRQGHGGPAMFQTLRFRAQRLARVANIGARPPLTILRTGEVRYISATENVALYLYSGESGVSDFLPADPALLAGRAEIVETDDQLDITIGGTLALRATAALLLVHSATDGQTYADDVPRLEFWLDGVRRGSLTQDGGLFALGFRDQVSAIAPDDSTALRLEDGAGRWLFSIGEYVTCRNMEDTLP